MNIAIVGCGIIADAHVNEIRKIQDTEIVAVCDKEFLMAAQLADRYDIPDYFDDFERMIKQCRPDVVHILTPPASHFSLGLAAIEAGCHVLMEKPFAVTRDEAVSLIEKAKLHKKKIMVNHFHNFSPPSLKLRDMVSLGVLGEVLHIEGFYSYSTKSPVAIALLEDRNAWLHQLPGKLLQNNIDHLIGKIVEFLPDSNPSVWACAKRVNDDVRKISHSYIHDELRVMIAGEKVTAYATFSSNISPFQHTMTVYGTKCSVSIDYESRTMILKPVSSLPGPFGKLSTPFIAGRKYIAEGFRNLIKFAKSDFHFYAGINILLKNFYKCIREKTDTPIPSTDIVKTTMIMDEIFRQISGDVQMKIAV